MTTQMNKLNWGLLRVCLKGLDETMLDDIIRRCEAYDELIELAEGIKRGAPREWIEKRAAEALKEPKE